MTASSVKSLVQKKCSPLPLLSYFYIITSCWSSQCQWNNFYWLLRIFFVAGVSLWIFYGPCPSVQKKRLLISASYMEPDWMELKVTSTLWLPLLFVGRPSGHNVRTNNSREGSPDLTWPHLTPLDLTWPHPHLKPERTTGRRRPQHDDKVDFFLNCCFCFFINISGANVFSWSCDACGS